MDHSSEQDKKTRRRRRRNKSENNGKNVQEAASSGSSRSHHVHPNKICDKEGPPHVDLTVSSTKKRRRGSREGRNHKRPKSTPVRHRRRDPPFQLRSQRIDDKAKRGIDDDDDSEVLEIPRPFSDHNKDDEEDDLEVPYYQSFSFPGSSQVLLCQGTAKHQEPLRAGDVIQYTHPMFVAGTAQGRRVAQIRAVLTSNNNNYVLSLSNGELLPKDTRVKRIREYAPSTQKLYEHSGIYRPIEHFLLTKGTLAAEEGVVEVDAMERQVQQMQQLLAEGRREHQTAFRDAFRTKTNKDKDKPTKRRNDTQKCLEGTDSEDENHSDSDTMEDGNKLKPKKQPACSRTAKRRRRTTSSSYDSIDSFLSNSSSEPSSSRGAATVDQKGAQTNGCNGSDSESGVEVSQPDATARPGAAATHRGRSDSIGSDSDGDSDSVEGGKKTKDHMRSLKPASERITDTAKGPDHTSDSDDDDELLNSNPLTSKKLTPPQRNVATTRTKPVQGENRTVNLEDSEEGSSQGSTPDSHPKGWCTTSKNTRKFPEHQTVNLEHSDDDSLHNSSSSDARAKAKLTDKNTRRPLEQTDSAQLDDYVRKKQEAPPEIYSSTFRLGKFLRATTTNKVKAPVEPRQRSSKELETKQDDSLAAQNSVRGSIDLTTFTDSSSSSDEEELEEVPAQRGSASTTSRDPQVPQRAECEDEAPSVESPGNVFDFDEDFEEPALAVLSANKAIRKTPLRVHDTPKSRNSRTSSSRKKQAHPSSTNHKGTPTFPLQRTTAAADKEQAQGTRYSSPRRPHPSGPKNASTSSAVDSSTIFESPQISGVQVQEDTRRQEEDPSQQPSQDDSVVDMISSVGTAHSSDSDLSDTEQERRQSTSELRFVTTSRVSSSRKAKKGPSTSETNKNTCQSRKCALTNGESSDDDVHEANARQKRQSSGSPIVLEPPSSNKKNLQSKILRHSLEQGTRHCTNGEQDANTASINPGDGGERQSRHGRDTASPVAKMKPTSPKYLKLAPGSSSSSSSDDDEEMAQLLAKHASPPGTLTDKVRTPKMYPGIRKRKLADQRKKSEPLERVGREDRRKGSLKSTEPSPQVRTRIQNSPSSSGKKAPLSRNFNRTGRKENENRLQATDRQNMRPPKMPLKSADNRTEYQHSLLLASNSHKNPYRNLTRDSFNDRIEGRGGGDDDDDTNWGTAVVNRNQFGDSTQSVDGDSITTSSFTQQAEKASRKLPAKKNFSQNIDNDSDTDSCTSNRLVGSGISTPKPSDWSAKPGAASSSTNKGTGKRKLLGAAVSNRHSSGGVARLSFTKVSRSGCRI